jgi:acyl-CoA dehydrogenase
MIKTIAFLENKGLKKIKKDYHEKVWNYDFVEFLRKDFCNLDETQGYGAEDSRWDTYRNCEFAEITSFYGLTYWYTFQVSMLGLGPIFLGENETVKHRTANLFEEGRVFGFGLSEEEHGADIYSTDMMLTPRGTGLSGKG